MYKTKKQVLIIGAGEAGSMVARWMLRHPESGLTPVGFLDDDPAKHQENIAGLQVLGRLQDLPKVVSQYKVDEVIMAIPSASVSLLRMLLDLARESNVLYKTLPSLQEIFSGSAPAIGIREVKLEDLLRRQPIRLNMDRIAYHLQGKTILITGAGGSIGSEICRQVAHFKPRQLVLLGRGENSIYLIEQELKRKYPELLLTSVIADVRDAKKLSWTFKNFRPEIVFHAAAHKHVPLMELHPDEAIWNNVKGTQNIAELCLDFNVSTFVNISTDKAVNPTSVMGASKRVAEYVVADAARSVTNNSAFISVRFGNVLGSRGSVIPLFKEQIRLGGPVTITHPDMTRYFMTIPEAVQLVMQAASVGHNGEVYVLDMGEPVKIVDLAKDLIRLSGFEPDKDIKIEFTGVRPGEKLFEELLTAEDGTIESSYEKMFVARVDIPKSANLKQLLGELFQASEDYDTDNIKRILFKLLPQCKHFKTSELPQIYATS